MFEKKTATWERENQQNGERYNQPFQIKVLPFQDGYLEKNNNKKQKQKQKKNCHMWEKNSVVGIWF